MACRHTGQSLGGFWAGDDDENDRGNFQTRRASLAIRACLYGKRGSGSGA